MTLMFISQTWRVGACRGRPLPRSHDLVLECSVEVDHGSRALAAAMAPATSVLEDPPLTGYRAARVRKASGSGRCFHSLW